MTQTQHMAQFPRPKIRSTMDLFARGSALPRSGAVKAFRNLSPEEMARGRPRHAFPRALPTGRAQINRDRPSNPSEVQQ